MSLLRMPEVLALTGLARTTIHRYEAAEPPMFPRRRRIGVRNVAWVRSEVEAWLASRETLFVNCKDAPRSAVGGDHG